MVTSHNGTRYLVIAPDGTTREIPVSVPLKAGWRLFVPVPRAAPAAKVPPTSTGVPSRASAAGFSGDGRTTALTVDERTES